MRIEDIEYVDEDYADDLLGRLLGQVFHLTTRAAFELIKEAGEIRHNREESFPINVASEASYGRKKGWVCLFSLRNKDKNTVQQALDKYYFLGPSWFCNRTPAFSEWNLAYLFLDSAACSDLVQNESAQEEEPHGHYIPEAEVWFPGNIPLDLIEEVLQVRIRIKAPKDDPRAYALHTREV